LAVQGVMAVQGVRERARELGISHESLRNWVKADAAGTLNGPETKAVMPEQMALRVWQCCQADFFLLRL
jgi:transposase